MKVIKSFPMGSRVFFGDIPGFTSKDYDELCILDTYHFPGNSFRLFIHGKDVFFYKNLTKEEFIEDTIKSPLPLVAGKFLVPEFSIDLGITISDLKRLKEVFDKIDVKHLYQKYIYECYVKNDDFFLTPEQKNFAYKIYLTTRTNNGPDS